MFKPSEWAFHGLETILSATTDHTQIFISRKNTHVFLSRETQNIDLEDAATEVHLPLSPVVDSHPQPPLPSE